MAVFMRTAPAAAVGDLASLGVKGRRTGAEAPLHAPRDQYNMADLNVYFSSDEEVDDGLAAMPSASFQAQHTAPRRDPASSPHAGDRDLSSARPARPPRVAYVLDASLSRMPSPPASAMPLATDTPAEATPRMRLSFAAMDLSRIDPAPSTPRVTRFLSRRGLSFLAFFFCCVKYCLFVFSFPLIPNQPATLTGTAAVKKGARERLPVSPRLPIFP